LRFFFCARTLCDRCLRGFVTSRAGFLSFARRAQPRFQRSPLLRSPGRVAALEPLACFRWQALDDGTTTRFALVSFDLVNGQEFMRSEFAVDVSDFPHDSCRFRALFIRSFPRFSSCRAYDGFPPILQPDAPFYGHSMMIFGDPLFVLKFITPLSERSAFCHHFEDSRAFAPSSSGRHAWLVFANLRHNRGVPSLPFFFVPDLETLLVAAPPSCRLFSTGLPRQRVIFLVIRAAVILVGVRSAFASLQARAVCWAHRFCFLSHLRFSCAPSP